MSGSGASIRTIPQAPDPHLKRGGGHTASAPALFESAIRRPGDEAQQSVGFRLVLAQDPLPW